MTDKVRRSRESCVDVSIDPKLSSDAVVAVEGVKFSYGDTLVLDGAALHVRRGTCMCLMGVNGCGKSTLLDCVLGAHRPSAGRIAICGQDAAVLRPAQLARLVAYVPQVHERSFPYTVNHVVLMGRTAHARSLAGPDWADESLALDALETCGIAHLSERPYTSLSGGEMQMVMLARALVQDTPIILMDEPTAHLDFRNELLFLETIEWLVRVRQVTVLMATHAPNQAFHLSQAGVPVDVALMSRGLIAQVGSPEAVLTQDALRDVFGVRACILEGWAEEEGHAVCQIAPLRTIARKDDVR